MDRDQNLERFFKDGRTVILPIDHGTAIPVPGLESPGRLIESLGDWVDGFVVNAGILRACAAELAGKGICLRTDVYKPRFGDNPDVGSFRVFGTHDARALGAHAVMNMSYPHHPDEARITRECAALVSESVSTGIPVILEALPFGIGRPDDYTGEQIGFVVRQAAELGADVVKTAYPGDARVFQAIVEACPVPVIVLGGAAGGAPEEILAMAADAVKAGAAGVAIGRNVWQHPEPVKMAKALAAIVHDDATAAEATKLLA